MLACGCTDPNACNYQSWANCDDGSCETIVGCMNPSATNYNPTACVPCNNCCMFN